MEKLNSPKPIVAKSPAFGDQCGEVLRAVVRVIAVFQLEQTFEIGVGLAVLRGRIRACWIEQVVERLRAVGRLIRVILPAGLELRVAVDQGVLDDVKIRSRASGPRIDALAHVAETAVGEFQLLAAVDAHIPLVGSVGAVRLMARLHPVVEQVNGGAGRTDRVLHHMVVIRHIRSVVGLG